MKIERDDKLESGPFKLRLVARIAVYLAILLVLPALTVNADESYAKAKGRQAKRDIDCTGIKDYSIKTTIQPNIMGGAGRYNFGDMYKDVVTLGNGVQLDIAYQSTFMSVNGKDGIFHYGLRADNSELSQAKLFASCYERQKPAIKKDRTVLFGEPDADIILLRRTEKDFVPVAHYVVEEKK